MEYVKIAIQLTIALGIYNVWLLRFGKATNWRGGSANSMKEEFEVYGIPYWFMMVIGFLKVSLATVLVVGIWFPVVILPSAIGMALLMTGALAMHFKVKDPLQKSLPAFTMFTLCLALVFVSIN